MANTTSSRARNCSIPAAATFEPVTGEESTGRSGAGVALLPSGKVFIVGGYYGSGNLRTAELYDPATQTFTAVSGEMAVTRYTPVAAVLPDGKVLVAGGYDSAEKKGLQSAELFDPETGKFEALPQTLTEQREEAGYVALADGNVLITGGYNRATNETLKTIELFHWETRTFEKLSTELVEPRYGPADVLLTDGRVLVAGGGNPGESQVRTAELSSVTPPTVATGAASGVEVAAAALNGSVVAETASHSYFQYGTTTSYGSATAKQATAASVKAVGFTAAVGGLAPSTTYHFRAVSENAGGVSYGADQTFATATPPPPSITSATQSRSRWREGSGLARISRRRVPVGTTFSFALNEQANVSFVFTQRVHGRKVRGKCVAQTRANRRKPACLRTVTRGTLAFSGHAGTNHVAFQGRLSRSRRLAPGAYSLLITASDATRRKSGTVRLTFTIVR